ncbi:CD59B glycoprotein isoform X1, partial [Tachysurus ichikawai]
SIRRVLKEKSCATPSVCGVTKEKHVAGLVFTFTTRCCDTDLCNSASTSTYAAPCWSRTAMSLVCMALTSLLSSE